MRPHQRDSGECPPLRSSWRLLAGVPPGDDFVPDVPVRAGPSNLITGLLFRSFNIYEARTAGYGRSCVITIAPLKLSDCSRPRATLADRKPAAQMAVTRGLPASVGRDRQLSTGFDAPPLLHRSDRRDETILDWDRRDTTTHPRCLVTQLVRQHLPEVDTAHQRSKPVWCPRCRAYGFVALASRVHVAPAPRFGVLVAGSPLVILRVELDVALAVFNGSRFIKLCRALLYPGYDINHRFVALNTISVATLARSSKLLRHATRRQHPAPSIGKRSRRRPLKLTIAA